MPFPDSGTYAALGYSETSGIPFETGMIRNHYVGRTFIQPTQSMRDFGVRIKLNPVKELLKGKDIIIIEDSIIRGTTGKSRVKSLRNAGAKEVHLRISSPPTSWPCFYGIDTPEQEKLLAARRGGIKTVIIPKENERDLKEVPDNIKEDLEIRAVKWIDEVLTMALESMPEPLSDEEFLADSISSGSESEQDEKNRINTH